MKNKIIKFLIYILTVYLFTLLQTNWALYEYRKSTSSSCLDCDFFSDVVIISIFPTIILFIIELFHSYFNSRLKPKLISELFILFFLWIVVNTALFEDRIAAWSTFTNTWLIGLGLTLVPGITLGILFCLIHVIYIFRIVK